MSGFAGDAVVRRLVHTDGFGMDPGWKLAASDGSGPGSESEEDEVVQQAGDKAGNCEGVPVPESGSVVHQRV